MMAVTSRAAPPNPISTSTSDVLLLTSARPSSHWNGAAQFYQHHRVWCFHVCLGTAMALAGTTGTSPAGVREVLVFTRCGAAAVSILPWQLGVMSPIFSCPWVFYVHSQKHVGSTCIFFVIQTRTKCWSLALQGTSWCRSARIGCGNGGIFIKVFCVQQMAMQKGLFLFLAVVCLNAPYCLNSCSKTGFRLYMCSVNSCHFSSPFSGLFASDLKTRLLKR